MRARAHACHPCGRPAFPVWTVRRQLLEDPNVLFGGYRVPHPLEPAIQIKVQTRIDGPNPAQESSRPSCCHPVVCAAVPGPTDAHRPPPVTSCAGVPFFVGYSACRAQHVRGALQGVPPPPTATPPYPLPLSIYPLCRFAPLPPRPAPIPAPAPPPPIPAPPPPPPLPHPIPLPSPTPASLFSPCAPSLAPAPPWPSLSPAMYTPPFPSWLKGSTHRRPSLTADRRDARRWPWGRPSSRRLESLSWTRPSS